MDFNLTKEQEMIQKMMRKFSETEVAPIAEELDIEAKFPFSSVEKLGKLGVMGMPFPAEYGGAGADYIAYIIAIEELSKVCGSHGVIVQTHNALCCWPIFTYGTEEQKRKYLPDLLSGRKLGAFGLTEPNAGTDAAMQQTKAVDMGDHWVINGTKIFISGGGIAEVYVVMAMTDKSKGTKGISAFILEGFRQISEKGPEARFTYLDEFVTASCYAGIAFLQAGCATVHAMSFPLGGTYNVPHGEANYALFGKVLEKYNEINPN